MVLSAVDIDFERRCNDATIKRMTFTTSIWSEKTLLQNVEFRPREDNNYPNVVTLALPHRSRVPGGASESLS